MFLSTNFFAHTISYISYLVPIISYFIYPFSTTPVPLLLFFFHSSFPLCEPARRAIPLPIHGAE